MSAAGCCNPSPAWKPYTEQLHVLGVLQAGDQIELGWEFYAVSETQECYHDGQKLTACNSPMTITANNLTSDTEHQFTVVMTDICGHQKNASYRYTSAGVTKMSQIDYIADTPTTGTGTVNTTTTKQNSAIAAAPAGLLLTGVAGLLSLLLVL